MNLIFFATILLFFSNRLDSNSHPIHVTVTNIEYNSNTNAFDYSIKLFYDDFETILNTQYNRQLNLGTESQLTETEFVKSVIKKDNVLWIYYTYKNSGIPKEVKITNTLMKDLYYDQKNLMIFTCNETQKGIKFNISKTTESFLIDN